MSLSKPSQILFDLVAAYMTNLFSNPVKTRAITSLVTATFGNFVAQRITGANKINQDSLIAFGLFGLLFGGPVPYFFYKYIRLFVKNRLGILVVERVVYTPLFEALSLYMLPRLEGKSHQHSCINLHNRYRLILMTNWKYLTLLQYINMCYVPPILKVLVSNIIGLVWTIYLAKVRTEDEANQN
ncbi:hypothetical protein PV325_002773 [Microctonus aethiopoides]|uniref:Peroxisomal membrane protein 2 n=1 Tax=Microctonus aethiopoides TaxID=144406 RepID=A0AA39CAG5_9HYME|nr:hypothetical protein PV325_002773 [Microctonus aethiopoides]KAK0092532.1 hypothetical protein PV326_001216 [Microctonus aethiopoides]KAK0160430.1 hypothetical protein PV328_007841 [Microctonus aethiopoides]